MSERNHPENQTVSESELDGLPPVIKKVIQRRPDRKFTIYYEDYATGSVVLDHDHSVGRGESAYAFKDDLGGRVQKLFFTRHLDTDPGKRRSQFSAEATTLKELNQAPDVDNFVAKTFGFGEVEITPSIKVPCITREFVPDTLPDLMNSKNETWTPESALVMTKKIGEALNFVFQNTKKKEIVADLIPNNIVRRKNGEWVLLEVGTTAKTTLDNNSEADIDTTYSAPECRVIGERKFFESSMVYNLALVYYHSLTGENLPETPNFSFIHLESISEKIDNPQEATAIYKVLEQALKEKPADRYQDINTFCLALEEAASPRPLGEIESIHTPENLISEKLLDLSGKNINDVRELTKEALEYAERMVVFPDLGFTERGIVPTGSVTEIDTQKHPEWLKVVSGADMGCGEVLATFTNLKAENFLKDQASLDKLRDRIAQDSSLYLGGGNHFIDFMVDDEQNVSVAIHTGAVKEMQKELTAIVEQAMLDGNWEKATAEYLAKYEKVVQSAHDNRLRILKAISEIYGESEVLFHEAHNTIAINKDKHTATIYKGAVHVKDVTKRQFMPSSRHDYADFYIPGPIVGEQTLHGISHGTGRAEATSVTREKNPVETNEGIMLPTGSKPSRGVAEGAYNSSVDAENIMLENGLMTLKNLEDIKQLKPIAHISNVKSRKKRRS